MNVPLNLVQPSELYVKREVVGYFLKHPDRLFKEHPQVAVYRCFDQPFRYYVRNGNNRLFAAWALGLKELPIPARTGNACLETALHTYREGIRIWQDLDKRIVPWYARELLYFNEMDEMPLNRPRSSKALMRYCLFNHTRSLRDSREEPEDKQILAELAGA